jgi:hypothetical protein
VGLSTIGAQAVQPNLIVTAVIKTLERYTLTDAAREDYLKSFEGERFAESMRYVRTYPEQALARLRCSSAPIQNSANRNRRARAAWL